MFTTSSSDVCDVFHSKKEVVGFSYAAASQLSKRKEEVLFFLLFRGLMSVMWLLEVSVAHIYQCR